MARSGRPLRRTAVVLATVACTTTALLIGAPGGAGAVVPGASAGAFGPPATAGGAVHHVPECASVRHADRASVVVPVVVDLGGSSGSPQVSCVSVPSGSNDAQVLAARAKLLGVPAPRYAISGLLCAIDGYPATGCGQQNGTHYAYWAYFHGGSSWTYANVGPASWTVSNGDVEGWRFEPDGSATPADPPPRSASDAPTLCPASVPTTTTTTTTPSGPVPPTTPATTAAPATRSTGGSTGPATGAPAPAASGPKPFVPGGSSGSAPAPGREAEPGAPAPTTQPPSPGGTTPTVDARHHLPVHLASRREGTHAGLPIGLLIGVALIAALAAAAVIRARRSTRNP